MKNKTSQTYSSPELEVLELNEQSVICQSLGTQTYSSMNAENWF